MSKKQSMHSRGLDVLGDGIGDFIPWLGAIGSIAGGKKDDPKAAAATAATAATAAGNSAAATAALTQLAVQKALQDEQNRQSAARAEASARSTQTLLIGLLAVIGVGGAYFIIKK